VSPISLARRAAGNRDDHERDAGDDREEDPADSGIGDLDGLMEQLGQLDWQRMVL
jgi:hypothetical protein